VSRLSGTRPGRRNGVLVDFPAAVTTAAEHAGLTLLERNVALLAGMQGDRLVSRASFSGDWRVARSALQSLIQPTLQDIAQDDGVVVLFVTCGVDERHRTLHRPLSEAVDLVGVVVQLLAILALERLPTSEIVTEPAPQLRAGCQIAGPFAEFGVLLGHTAWPDPIDQNPVAITRRRLVVHPP
jgi:hypothetical protein